MSPPTIRDTVLARFKTTIGQWDQDPRTLDTLVLELEQILESQTVRLPRRPKAEDPNLVALQWPAPDAVRPAHAASDYQAARAALRAPEPPPAPDRLPPLPDSPQEPQP